MARIASLDYGLARIGVALSDERGVVALPLQTVKVEKTLQATLLKLAELLKPYSIEKIIIGNPLNMNGSKSQMGEEVEKFKALLETHFTCPIVLWDERLSTVQAERALREASLNWRKRKKVIDQSAATLLLQSFLEFNSLNMH